MAAIVSYTICRVAELAACRVEIVEAAIEAGAMTRIGATPCDECGARGSVAREEADRWIVSRGGAPPSNAPRAPAPANVRAQAFASAARQLGLDADELLAHAQGSTS
jgi:hypothetical protein